MCTTHAELNIRLSSEGAIAFHNSVNSQHMQLHLSTFYFDKQTQRRKLSEQNRFSKQVNKKVIFLRLVNIVGYIYSTQPLKMQQ